MRKYHEMLTKVHRDTIIGNHKVSEGNKLLSV